MIFLFCTAAVLRSADESQGPFQNFGWREQKRLARTKVRLLQISGLEYIIDYFLFI